MLLHVMQMWPDVINSKFWSYAFLHTVHLHNCTPRSNETMSPFTLFTNENMATNPNDFKVFAFIPGLCSWPILTVWISQSWKMLGEVISTRGICWTFAAPCEQCNPCIQPKDSTGIISMPHHTQQIIWDCSDQHIWSRCTMKTRWDVGCFICYLLMDPQWHIYWLQSAHNVSSLSWEQLGFCKWNHPCCSPEKMCPWPITQPHCRLQGRY